MGDDGAAFSEVTDLSRVDLMRADNVQGQLYSIRVPADSIWSRVLHD